MAKVGFAKKQPMMADSVGVPESPDIRDDMAVGAGRFLGVSARRIPMGRKRIG